MQTFVSFRDRERPWTAATERQDALRVSLKETKVCASPIALPSSPRSSVPLHAMARPRRAGSRGEPPGAQDCGSRMEEGFAGRYSSAT